jgi:hypothetical protein
LVAGKPDRRWSTAPVVALDGANLPNVRWQGVAGGEARPVEWLAVALKPGKPLQVDAAADSAGFVWALVEGPDNLRYVRVLPKVADKATEFHLLVQAGNSTDEPRVELRRAPPAAAKFPY